MAITPLKRFRLPLTLSSWIAFAISLAFYWITADPEASYWDCPEYVVNASKFEVGHPPGNPIWMLVMRVATIPFAPQNHAYVINLWSGVFTAFATLFLCRLIFLPARLWFGKLRIRRHLKPKQADLLAASISIGASLCFALCDSVWFSAIEAEVYAMSIFLASLSLWIMALWWMEPSKSTRTRYLILVAYVTGISLGVHQLNLLLIPVFALIVLYKIRPRNIMPLFLISYVIAFIGLIGIILMAFLPGVLLGAQSMELYAVNGIGLPYHYGVVLFCILVFIFLMTVLALSGDRRNRIKTSINNATWMTAFLLLGFSSFGIIMTRSIASPFMNEGTPENIFALASYINRDQYPSQPLLYGNTPYSKPIMEETWVNGNPYYRRYLLKKGKRQVVPFYPDATLLSRSGMLSHEDSIINDKILQRKHGYVIADYNFSQVLTPELNMWFPRITSRNPSHLPAYVDWAGMTPESMDKVRISETIDSTGTFQPRMSSEGERIPSEAYRPTYFQNLRYFVAYQAYYMYFRYLFWNFIGRQNDRPSTGEIEHGNFIFGLPFIDNWLIGDTSNYPPELWVENKGRNRYFAIPFLFGIAGMVWLAAGRRKKRRVMALISLLFLMTGLAIVVYLNQNPGEPRERDYTFLGNYMAFAMWIGAGFTALATLLIKRLPPRAAVFLGSVVSLGPATLMAIENFDDHDRRGRFEVAFYASSILDFELPAIIFSQGDLSAYPLWYAVETLGKGSNHSNIETTYLSLPSYVINLKKQGERGIQTLLQSSQMAYGKFTFTKIPSDSGSTPIPLPEALKTLYRSEGSMPEWSSSKVIIPIDCDEAEGAVINLHDFSNGSPYLSFSSLMLLDIIASHSCATEKNILYFPSTLLEHSFYRPLDPLLKPALFGKVYAPSLSRDETIEIMKISAGRELAKLEKQNTMPHYVEPVVADQSIRYRGNLIIAARELLESGDTVLPVKIVETIDKKFPYDFLLPGSFTLSDSTFYEGKEFSRLLLSLYEETGDPDYKRRAIHQDSLIDSRHRQFLKFYHSLAPEHRQYLSNPTKRLLIK